MRSRSGGVDRRTALKLAGASAALVAMKPFAWAQGRTGLHGLSVFGDIKYGPDFKHFDYVNPQAPKGGTIHFQPPTWFFNQNVQTFNTMNSFVLRGDAPPRMEITFDSLMAAALDEPDSVYGLLAESVAVSDDGNVYRFTLREGPRFHDGSELTAKDVAFSLMTLKEVGHPNISQEIRSMASAEAEDARTVVVTFDGTQTRTTILTVVGLPVFSKEYYTTRTFDSSTMEPPPGSGAYKVGRVSAGRFVAYERVPDYWGADLPVNVGHNNFDTIGIEFFTERQTAFEAFKKGEITHREEFTSITWATGYDFPAFLDGRVKKSLFPREKRPSFQGWFFNTRRKRFADPRTRQAIGLAFDFEWSNRNLFFDAYMRTDSFFGNSEYAAEGEPTPQELELLEPFRAELPPEVFGEAVLAPRSDGSGRDRAQLKKASELLAEAGWTRGAGSVLVSDGGERLTCEFLIRASIFERVLTPFVENLRLIGVDASIRQIDSAQYESRLNDYNFDVVMFALQLEATPLEGLQLLFGSEAAESPGTYNLAGVREPAIDAILKRLPKVSSREELTTITRAIDRIFRAKYYWVPNWFQPDHRVAHWDVFGWPEVKPDFGFPVELTWWYDRDKASAIGKAG